MAKELLKLVGNVFDHVISYFLLFFLLFVGGLGFIYGSFSMIFWFVEKGADPKIIFWSLDFFIYLIFLGIVIFSIKFFIIIIQKFLFPLFERAKENREKKTYEYYNVLAKMIASEISKKKRRGKK